MKLDKFWYGKRYKARLCARGFRQIYGIDYEETFSPVVRYDSIRVLLALAAYENLEMRQFDVKTTFLYGELLEDIYIAVPEGVDVCDKGLKEPVGKLNKALYGLKQASRCWGQFASSLSKFGFKVFNSNNSIYRGTVLNTDVTIAMFVDDGLVLSKSLDAIDVLTNELKERFEIVTNEPNITVGVQIERNRDERFIRLHQSEYALKILNKFNMIDANPVCTPADTSLDLRSNKSSDGMQRFPFRELVSSLMFLCNVTRPDLPYSVNVISRYVNN